MMNSGLCSIPPLGGIEIELHRLYVEVTARGGLEKVPPYLHSVTGRLVLLNLSQRLLPFIFSDALGVSRESQLEVYISQRNITCSGCMLRVSSWIQERMAIGLH